MTEPAHDRCGYAVVHLDGNEEPCGRPHTGWRWYQRAGEHEDLLDAACDWHANEGGRRIHEAESALLLLRGTCPKCRETKFIGHGPLCSDCYLGTVSERTEDVRMTKPPMVMRSHRYPAALYEAAKAKAEERGENLSDVLREALERYTAQPRIEVQWRRPRGKWQAGPMPMNEAVEVRERHWIDAPVSG